MTASANFSIGRVRPASVGIPSHFGEIPNEVFACAELALRKSEMESSLKLHDVFCLQVSLASLNIDDRLIRSAVGNDIRIVMCKRSKLDLSLN